MEALLKEPLMVAATVYDNRAKNKPIVRAAFVLTAVLISLALVIGYITYNFSYEMMVRSYEKFYLNKAQMLVNSVNYKASENDAHILQDLNAYWNTAKDRPKDEYICVVDKNGKLLLHTGSPETIGKYAGDNPVLGDNEVKEKKLCELVASRSEYVGNYISSAGQDQIAAFVAIPHKNWFLGVHRSRSALHAQIRHGYRPLIVGFVLVCGVLMPGSLFLLYRIFVRAQHRESAFVQALSSSEKRYQSLVDTMPLGLYRTDLQGNITFANRALADWIELPVEKCLGETIYNFYPEDVAREYLADDLEVVRASQGVDVLEVYRLKADGKTKSAEIMKTPVHGSDGDIIGLQGLVWDVTKRKQAEKKLEYTTAQLHTILQSVPSGIMTTDVSGTFTLINHKAEEILGFQAKDAIGKAITEFIPDSGLIKVISQKKTEFGKPFPFGKKTLIVSRSPIFDGNKLLGAVSVFHDESELESVQKQLREMKRLNDEFSSLVENSHDGVLITDQEKVLRVNPSFGRITGIVPSSLEEKAISRLDSENHVCLHAVKEVFGGVNRSEASITLRRRLKGGNEIFITGSPVKNQLGQIERVVMNFRDVTELESLESQIKKLSKACLESPGAVTRSIEAAAGIVAESLVTKNVLTYAIRVADVDSTVVLIGESGVGKDLFAGLIHKLSKRSDKPFVSVNCGAIPETLLESEFFGYEKGAFSGADKDGKPGLSSKPTEG
jgi:PAS domain S-box-containing protein